MNNNKISIGGQAVIEGVMMRGTRFLVTAVRRPSGKIVYKKNNLIGDGKKILKKPFIRGVTMLFESLVIGVKELTFSANQAGEETGETLSNKEAILTTIVSLAFGIGIFIVFPAIIGSLLFPNNKMYANLLEAIFRLLAFVGYIWGISFSKDIKRVFEYHGAEHKSIYAYENNMELTPENAKQFSTLHPRCGTSFLFIVMFIAIIIFSIIDFLFPVPATWFSKFLLKVVLRILLMPIIASISYEIQRYSSKHLDNLFIKVISFPGLALQKITTKEPDLNELEVAIVAIKVSLGENVNNAEEVFE